MSRRAAILRWIDAQDDAWWAEQRGTYVTELADLVLAARNNPEAEGNPMHLLGDPASFDEAEADPPSLASARPVSVEHLIERSSLGTPEAQALRASAPPESVAKVLARVDELEHGQRRRYKCAHPECPGYPWPASEVAHPCGTKRDAYARKVAALPEMMAHAPPPPPEPLAPDVEPETCGCEESLWLRARMNALSTQSAADAGLREDRGLFDQQQLVPLTTERVALWMRGACQRLDEKRDGPHVIEAARLTLEVRYEGEEEGSRYFTCCLTEEQRSEVEGVV